MLTLVPERLTQDLSTSSLRGVDVFCLAVLGDLATGVLGIAAMLVKLCHLHLLLDLCEVDGLQRVEVGHSPGGEGETLLRGDGGVGGAGRGY